MVQVFLGVGPASGMLFYLFLKILGIMYLGLMMDVHMSLFVSPIVFPLAFSINGRLNKQDFQPVVECIAKSEYKF